MFSVLVSLWVDISEEVTWQENVFPGNITFLLFNNQSSTVEWQRDTDSEKVISSTGMHVSECSFLLSISLHQLCYIDILYLHFLKLVTNQPFDDLHLDIASSLDLCIVSHWQPHTFHFIYAHTRQNNNPFILFNLHRRREKKFFRLKKKFIFKATILESYTGVMGDDTGTKTRAAEYKPRQSHGSDSGNSYGLTKPQRR